MGLQGGLGTIRGLGDHQAVWGPHWGPGAILGPKGHIGVKVPHWGQGTLMGPRDHNVTQGPQRGAETTMGFHYKGAQVPQGYPGPGTTIGPGKEGNEKGALKSTRGPKDYNGD